MFTDLTCVCGCAMLIWWVKQSIYCPLFGFWSSLLIVSPSCECLFCQLDWIHCWFNQVSTILFPFCSLSSIQPHYFYLATFSPCYFPLILFVPHVWQTHTHHTLLPPPRVPDFSFSGRRPSGLGSTGWLTDSRPDTPNRCVGQRETSRMRACVTKRVRDDSWFIYDEPDNGFTWKKVYRDETAGLFNVMTDSWVNWYDDCW